MDIKKLLMGGIVAGILFFLLGWLAYGKLLAGFFAAHPGTAMGVDRAEKDIQFLYLGLGNILMGFALAYVFVKSNVSSLASGLVTGGVLGLLFSAGMDCIIYGTTNIMSKTMMAGDVATSTVMWAITGAVIGAMMGMGKKAA